MKKTQNRFFSIAPWLILIVGSACTIYLWNQSVSNYKAQYRSNFKALAIKIVTAIKDRLDVYIDAHYAGVGLFVASNNVSRAEWQKFVTSIHLVDRYPGINGLGHAALVKDKDKIAYEQELQKDYPGFKIKPPGKRADYITIPYIEPVEMNKVAVGFDMGSESNRRLALESARDLGKPFITAKIILVQDAAKTPGFLTYVPIYKDGIDPGNIEDRRKNFRGWIYAPLIIKDFINGVLNLELKSIKNDFSLDISNDKDFSPDQILFSSIKDPQSKNLTEVISLDLYGQKWTLKIQASDAYMLSIKESSPLSILIMGLILTILMFFLFLNMANTRKAAENLAGQMTKELKESQEQLDLTLKVSSIGLWQWKLKDNSIQWDEGNEDIYGLEHGSFAGDYEAFKKLLHPDDIEKIEDDLNSTIENRVELDSQFRIIRPDQELRYIAAKGRAIYDDLGNPIKMLGVNYDITERELAKIEIEEKSKELKRSNDELEQFAYITSHDLQEPLRMVTSYVELLVNYLESQDIVLDDKRKKYVNYITDSVKRMRDMIRDILHFSKVGKAAELEKVNTLDIIETTKNNLEERIISSEAEIILNGEFPTLNARKVELIQLFQNLLSNAMKFVKDGTKPKITISVKEDSPAEWLFSVEDNGIGIEPEYFDKIFLMFQRLDRVSDYKGTGIGLTLCKKIIEKHHGKIWLESKLGQGTKFFFTLKD